MYYFEPWLDCGLYCFNCDYSESCPYLDDFLSAEEFLEKVGLICDD